MQKIQLAYSKKQAAAEISLSVRTIDYLIKRGDLVAKKFGKKVLIPGDSLVRLIQKGIKGNPSRVDPKIPDEAAESRAQKGFGGPT